jgi:hypothetical protein
MHGLEMPQIAVGERSVEEEGFPYPGLSEEHHACLTSFETRNEHLQGSLMAPTRKEPGWLRRVRERITVQVIKMGLDHGVGHLLLFLYDAKAPHCRKNKAFKGLGHYAEWPKVADAVIKAPRAMPDLAKGLVQDFEDHLTHGVCFKSQHHKKLTGEHQGFPSQVCVKPCCWIAGSRSASSSWCLTL